MARFPLGQAVSEENRGVDPKVLRDIGYELPHDYQESRNVDNHENPHWPTEEQKAVGRIAINKIRNTLHIANPPQPRD